MSISNIVQIDKATMPLNLNISRVKAVNAEGESDPLESDEAILAVNPYTVPDPPQNVKVRTHVVAVSLGGKSKQ